MKNVNHIIEKFENSTDKGKEKMTMICKNAAQVFAKNSYMGTTLGDIAQATGISKAGIFHYFAKKEEILFWIVYKFLHTNFLTMKNKIDACESNQEKLLVSIQNTIDSCRDNQNETRIVFMELRNLSGEYIDVIREKQREYTSSLKTIVEKLIDKRSKDANDLTLITFCLLGMCSWSYTWFKPDGKSTTVELSETIYRIFMGDLKILKPR